MRNSLVLAFLFLLGLAACNEEFTDPNDPKYDNTEVKGILLHTDQLHQTMHHFGASDGWAVSVIGKNWPESDKELISKLLFSQDIGEGNQPQGIGLSMWRTNIGAGSANQSNNGFAADAWFRATECALQPDGTYDWTQQEGSRWFLKKAKEMGVEYVTGWVTSPPYFMTKNGYTFSTPGTGGFNLDENKYVDFARYLSSFIAYNESQDITFDYVSPVNEPQWSWQAEVGTAAQEGSSATNQEISDLVEKINLIFALDQIQTKIILPEGVTTLL